MTHPHPQNTWQSLVTTALLGTDRQTLPPLNPGGALGDLLAGLPADDPASAVLNAAAVITLHQRAGRLPDTDDGPLSDPCETDDLPYCTPAASEQLALMLKGEYRDILREWLELAAAHHQRIPERLLPTLLEVGHISSVLQPLIRQVIGKRGRWLAAQVLHWNYAIDGSEDNIWQHGNVVARALLIQRLRSSDPDHARDLLLSTWKDETASDRLRLISQFEIGLSMADEPFLESALDDRTQAVRSKAADLLSQLVESRLHLRMTELASQFVVRVPGDKLELKVILPMTDTKSMIRDGILPQPESLRFNTLLKIISSVSPQYWCQKWNTSPAALIEAAQHSQGQTALLRGWEAATNTHKDIQWAEALLPITIETQSLLYLAYLLPVERREAVICEALAAPSLTSNAPVFAMMQAYPFTWSRTLARYVLERVRDEAAKKPTHYNFPLAHYLKSYAVFAISPDFVDEAETILMPVAEQVTPWLRTIIAEFIGILRFRNQIHKELSK